MIDANPYTKLPRSSYWRTSVVRAAKSQGTVADLWTPKFAIAPTDKTLTTGSCFAQHIGKALTSAGFAWHDAEPAPFGISDDLKKEFHYGVFSFRVGNVYTPEVLKYWLSWAINPDIQDREVWEQDGAFFDPLRPQIEPDGFETAEDLFAARDATFEAIRNGIKDASVFVFTLGLTECWFNQQTGLVYSSCPGTIAGTFDAQKQAFRNLDYPTILDSLHQVQTLLKQINPDIRMLLTVSPVPLAATAAPAAHVLTATVASKSILRAAAGAFTDQHGDVDYFPSYEIVTHPGLGRDMFEPDRRGVTPKAVAYVMQHFFEGLGVTPTNAPPQETDADKAVAAALEADDLVCEEIELEKFNANPD
ncbi:GSCFA domain-containing protein [Thalassobium sp. R2A62]|uniref:GSCFA domain-containing protein n=1 Tax=Thalassobium sp. R2A62 TaxID=633131 RepID=UPI0001B1D3E0|nr:GSCFA domain-containing protein [Thalassobium sp. R2A62]EET48949.1 gscfa domain protein [Thalassobium sp. R2A62]MDG2453749.1 GSCFA domain-containing protein [Paracoccaceae bacterium]